VDQGKKHDERQLYRDDIKEKNNIGKRIEFIHEKLRLNTLKVAEATGIPASTMHDRKLGVRSVFWEELEVLRLYYDLLWQNKFQNGYL